jgi:rRNA maturation RNase YbeY
LRGVAQRALRAGLRTGVAVLSVSFVGDRRMRSLNRSFAGDDYVTDVLSFPALEGATPSPRQRAAETDFGDVIICLPQAERQARAARHSLKAEVDLLLTHGVLHLLGFDHDTQRHRAAMDRAQARALRAP